MPECGIADVGRFLAAKGLSLSREEATVVETQIKYEGYIAQQRREVDRLRASEAAAAGGIWTTTTYPGAFPGSGRKARCGRARRISARPRGSPGVTPAALSILQLICGASPPAEEQSGE